MRRLQYSFAVVLAASAALAEVDWTANTVAIDEGTEAAPVVVSESINIKTVNIGSSRSAYVEIAAGGCLNNPDKSGSVAMGVGSGATGVLKIDRGGTCTPYSTTVGNEGVGLLLIDGGTNRTARTTYVGKTNGASGEIRICGGGEFYGGTSESEIGGYGSATIHVVNGTFSHSLSAFGVNETGSGVVWVMGSGEMSSQNNSITLGREGTGIVYMRGGT